MAAGSRPGHPEARGRPKSEERGGPGPHAEPDGQILVFWIVALRQLARSAAGDCQFSPTEPVKPTKRAQLGLNLVVHTHTPLRDRMRSTTSTGTESRGHQSTPDHGGVPPCCLPVIRRNVPADAARSHTHMQDLSRDEKQRSNRPISDRLRRWISARNGRPRSDHDRVVMGRLSLAVRLH